MKHLTKIILIAVPIAIIVIFGIMFFTTPNPNQPKLVSQSNQGTAFVPTQTAYKNNLDLNWSPVTWAEAIDSPMIIPESNLTFPKITQNQNVYRAGNVTYCDAGNAKLTLDIYSSEPPIAGSKKPMVIYIPGGGLVRENKRQVYADADRVLLSLVNDGYIVAIIDYRLAPEYKYPAMIQDVLCSIRFLKYYSYGIGGDQNQIGLLGGSVGGQLVSLAGATSGNESWENSKDENLAGANLTYEQYLDIPAKPNAVASYYGGTNLPDNPLQLFIASHSGSWYDPVTEKNWPMKVLFDDIYGSNLTVMREASAIHYVASNEPPFLIVQGDKDELSDPQLAADFYAALKNYNNSAALLVVKNAGHNFMPVPSGATIDPSFETIINKTVEFLESNLNNSK